MKSTRIAVSVVLVTLLAVGAGVTAVGASATDATATQVVPPGVQYDGYSSFDVSNLSATPGDAGEPITVTADVTNPTNYPMIQQVEVRVDGDRYHAKYWALNPGETDEITFSINPGEVDPGTRVVSVLTETKGEVTTIEVSEVEPTTDVVFDDQTTDGSSAVVASASNESAPFYAAVWTVNESTGTPMTLLGYEQVNDTSASDLTVALDESVNESQTLVAAVHPDADGNASTADDPVANQILASDTANVTVEEAPPAPEAAIALDDQTTDGSSAVVASASNESAPFYAAVWTVNESTSEPMTLLGFEHVDDTSASDLTVAFSESINESQTLVAAVHPDADGNASTADDPVADQILASDTANVTVEEAPPAPEAAVTFEDQTSNGTDALVASASNESAPFYAAVWTVNESTGAPVTLLGYEHVDDTSASDLTVAFSESINESQTLVAAVHPDADGNASTADDPVADQILASDTANVTVEAAS